MGQHLDLKEEYMDLVRTRKKTSTIRAGRRNIELGMSTIGNNGNVAHVLVTKVSYTFFDLLKHVDAVRDGFNSMSELEGVLLTIYPGIKGNNEVTIIEFEYVGNPDA